MTKSKTVFDVLENPEGGWVLRELRRVETIDDQTMWQVELVRLSDGLTISRASSSLFVAWARVTEAAHMIDQGLNTTPWGAAAKHTHARVERQQDEYFCSACGKRWAVSEDAPACA